MKSKRRHELQENALAEEIVKIWDFLKTHGNKLATGVLAIAVIILIIVVVTTRMETASVTVQNEWDQAMTANIKPEARAKLLKDLSEQTDNPRIAALATVEIGFEAAKDGLLAKTDAERDKHYAQAAQEYERVISHFTSQTDAVAKAHVGLGKLYESQGKLQQAAGEYQLAKSDENLYGYPVTLLAEMSLARLKELQGPVRMATSMPTTAPAIMEPAAAATTAPATSAPAATTAPAKS